MRYYLFGFLFAAISTLLFNLGFNERAPASFYPNFSGSATTELVAPTPRKLKAPENSSNPVSMKDVEDTYSGFLANEVALAEKAKESRTRLQYYLNLRNNNPSAQYYINPTSRLYQAIQAEQNLLASIEMQRQSNSSYAYNQITLQYLSIQIGLPQRSHARVDELRTYILSIQTDAMMSGHPTMFSPTTIWAENQLLEFTPQPIPTMTGNPVENPVRSEDFIGPRLPEQPSSTDSGFIVI